MKIRIFIIQLLEIKHTLWVLFLSTVSFVENFKHFRASSFQCRSQFIAFASL